MSTGKQKIFTLGCSFTYGHGFPDCYDFDKHFAPSKFAWPAILEQKIDRKVINISSPGASCKETARRFLHHNHLMAENDIVIVAWPYFDRSHIALCSKLDGIAKLTIGIPVIKNPGEGLEDIDIEHWFKYYTNDYNQLEEFMTACMLITNTCRLKGLHVINMVFNEQYKRQVKSAMKDPDAKWFDAPIERSVMDCVPRNYHRFRRLYNKTFADLPDGHRGKSHHQVWAERFYRKIVRRGWLN